MLGSNPLGLLPRRLRSRTEGLRQPIQLAAFLPFDSGENAINPNAWILKISKQISDRYPFTINADQTEIHFTLNQNSPTFRNRSHGGIGTMSQLHAAQTRGLPNFAMAFWTEEMRCTTPRLANPCCVHALHASEAIR
jgi:hypothetical protein